MVQLKTLAALAICATAASAYRIQAYTDHFCKARDGTFATSGVGKVVNINKGQYSQCINMNDRRSYMSDCDGPGAVRFYSEYNCQGEGDLNPQGNRNGCNDVYLPFWGKSARFLCQ